MVKELDSPAYKEEKYLISYLGVDFDLKNIL